MSQQGFFARFSRLWRGIFGARLTKAEARNAEAVYHNAITERAAQVQHLKEAVGKLIYLRNRVEAQLQGKKSDLLVVEGALMTAVQHHDDPQAKKLIAKQRELQHDVERLTQEWQRLAEQAQSAKAGLHEAATQVRRLKDEQTEMLARKAHATARIQVQESMQWASSVDVSAVDSALENVRASIMQLEASAGLESELQGTTDDDVPLDALRKQVQEAADEQRLAELKAQWASSLLQPKTVVEASFIKRAGVVR